MPDLISDDSEEEHEAVVARALRPPRPDAEALLTLGVSNDAAACRRAPYFRLHSSVVGCQSSILHPGAVRGTPALQSHHTG